MNVKANFFHMPERGCRQHLRVQEAIVTINRGSSIADQCQAVAESNLRLVCAQNTERPYFGEQAVAAVQSVNYLNRLR